MDKTAEKLRTRLSKAAESMQRAKDERDRLILEASRRGMSRREVGRAVGLTGSGVQNVISSRVEQKNGSAAGGNGSR